jgi:hypothetical protein
MTSVREHDHVELTQEASGHAAGSRGTIVSLGTDRALVEFVDGEGRTMDLADLPLDVLRRVPTRTAA